MSAAPSLGQYLKDRRARIDPSALGLPSRRRRTPGLRREEVAQRANISPTWYAWLEQGRGGAPSAAVLDRIAGALMLTEVEREHLFFIGLNRPPQVRYQAVDGVSPRLQRVLDALETTPAMIRTATWDAVAWNRAFAKVFTDYSALPPSERNILKLIFCDPRARAIQHDWEAVARLVISSFRIDAARAGAVSQVAELVDELCRRSPDFERLWRDNDIPDHGDGFKRLRHPDLGAVAFELSTFAVDGRTDLSMVVYNPATPELAGRIAALIEP